MDRPKPARALTKIAGAASIRTIGALSAFLLSILVSRHFGAAGAGYFFGSLTAMFGLSIVAKFGFDKVTLREIAANYNKDFPNHARQVFYSTVAIILTLSVICMITVTIGDKLLNGEDRLSEQKYMVGFIAYCLAPAALLAISSAALKGSFRPISASVVEFTAVPVIVLSALATLIWLDLDIAIEQVAVLYAAVLTLIALLVALMVTRSLAGAGAGRAGLKSGSISVRRYWSESRGSAGHFFIIDSMAFIIGWSSLLLLASFVSVGDVGFYNAALRTASLLAIFQFGIASVTSPRFARAWEEENSEHLAYLVKSAARLMFVLAAIVLLAVLISGRELMGLFGAGFGIAAYTPFVILMVFRCISFMCGPSQELLSMTGNEAAITRSMTGGAVLILSLSLLLIPLYGIVGAAVATGISDLFVKLLMTRQAYIRAGVLCLPLSFGIKR